MPRGLAQIACDECGKSFANESALFTHQRRFCKSSKKGFREILADARAYWRNKVAKRPRSRSGAEGDLADLRNSEEIPATRLGGQPLAQGIGACGDVLEQQGFERGQPRRTRLYPLEPVSPDTISCPPPGTSVDVEMGDPSSIPSEGDEQQGSTRERPRRARLPPQSYRDSPSPNIASSPLPDTYDNVEIGDQHPAPLVDLQPPLPSTNPAPQPLQSVWCTPANSWGLSRHFYCFPPPSHDPETATAPDDDGYQNDHPSSDTTTPNPDHSKELPLFPYPNRSSFELGDWWGKQVSKKSISGFTELVSIITHPEFNKDDLAEANWPEINRLLSGGCFEAPISQTSTLLPESDWIDDTSGDWVTTNLVLDVPFPTGGKKARVLPFSAGTFHHCKILSVIKERISDPKDHPHRYLRPFKLFWNPPDAAEGIRVYGDLYMSDEYLRIEEDVQSRKVPDEHSTLERVVVALMFWTDATLLANFGTAKLWPCYLFFGNDPKKRRAKISLNLCNHIAYFETLKDSFKDWYRQHSNGKNPSKALITHCARELFHLQWRILMSDELLNAMEFGIKLLCPDGISRLFFPRVFTYSADYPEKITIATLRYNGLCFCPRCLIQQSDIDPFGRREDDLTRVSNARVDTDARQNMVKSARALMYAQGYAIGYDKVNNPLKEHSLVPTENAFSRLRTFGFDVFASLVVDLMHEFELGVWKTLFIHLIRILEAQDRLKRSSLVSELDRRYRAMPAFGPDTIRTFSSNASEQKRLGARDYENLLQCSYAAFYGLLPEPHNKIVGALLLSCAEWHALAKLRMHTEETLHLLDIQTAVLAKRFETFIRVTCQSYDTRETAKERKARFKRAAKAAPADQEEASPSLAPHHRSNTDLDPVGDRAATAPPPTSSADFSAHSSPVEAPGSESTHQPSGSSNASLPPSPSTVSTPSARKNVSKSAGRLKKEFNIATYKYHALADYTSTIRQFGTTDSYSSERGEIEHKFPKSWFLRTDKKAYKLQLAKIERRRANHRRIRQRVAPLKRGPQRRNKSSLAESYSLSASENVSLPMDQFIANSGNLYDPAHADFVPALQRHILPRIKQKLADRAEFEGRGPLQLPADPSDWSFVVFKGHRLFQHQTIRIRYTSYDLQREEDLIRPHGPKSNIMIVNPEYPGRLQNETTDCVSPFLYAHVLGIYHANIIYVGPGNADLVPQRLDFLWVRWYCTKGQTIDGVDLLALHDISSPDAFGFIDPANVCRGCHIIPHFAEGRKLDTQGQSYAARDSEDYNSYLPNRHADRDMCMRYHWGLGIGHTYSHGSRRQVPPGVNEIEDIGRQSGPEAGELGHAPTEAVDDDGAEAIGTDDAEAVGLDDDAEEVEPDDDAEAVGRDDMVYRSSDEEDSELDSDGAGMVEADYDSAEDLMD